MFLEKSLSKCRYVDRNIPLSGISILFHLTKLVMAYGQINDGTPLTFYTQIELNLRSNKYANYHGLKHAGLGSLLY